MPSSNSSLSDFVAKYPEKLLLAWLAAAERRYLARAAKKRSGPSSVQLNARLRALSPEQFADLKRRLGKA